MHPFTTQHSILGTSGGLRDRISCVQWTAFFVLLCASFGIATAAGVDEIGAFNNVRTRSVTSVVVNDSQPKNLAVSGSNAAIGIKLAIDESESSMCNEKKQPLCRDLAASEFHMTSLRFMPPEVRGLSPKSLNVRRNLVSATYTFR